MADWQRFRPRRQQDKLIVIVLVEGAHRYRYRDTNTQIHRCTDTQGHTAPEAAEFDCLWGFLPG